MNMLTYLRLKVSQFGKSDSYNQYGYWSYFSHEPILGECFGRLWVSWPQGFKPKKYRKMKPYEPLGNVTFEGITGHIIYE